jgi:hypothetical protein
MPPLERTPSGRVTISRAQPDPAKARAEVAVARTHHIVGEPSEALAERIATERHHNASSSGQGREKTIDLRFGGTIDQQRDRGRKCELGA